MRMSWRSGGLFFGITRSCEQLDRVLRSVETWRVQSPPVNSGGQPQKRNSCDFPVLSKYAPSVITMQLRRSSLVLLTFLLSVAASAQTTPPSDAAAAKPNPSAREQPVAPAAAAPLDPALVNAPTATSAAPVPGAPAGPPLTVEECVARALNKNFDLRIQRFSTESAKEDVTIARAAFDPAIELSTSRYHRRDPGASVRDPSGNLIDTQYSQDGDTTRLGISQQLVTGATVSASGNLSRSDNVPSQLLLNPAYNSDVALSVRQPLLRNAGTRVNRAALERARLGVSIANLDFKSQVLAVVRNVEIAYYNLAFAREQLNVRRFSLEVAQSLFEENRTRRQTGVAIDLDVLQAEVGVANARRNLLLAEQEVHDREDALISEIEPFGFANTSLGPVSLPTDPVPPINSDLSYKKARDNTPDYQSAEALLKQLQIDADVARRNRLPTLDVGGTAGYSAQEKSYGRASREVWDGDGYNWQLDLTLSLPIGLRADRARYRQSLLNVNREQMRLEQLDQSIMVQVRAAVRAVQTNQEGVQISSLATELSRRQYELEKARYDAGLSTFRRVQESQADWDTAKVNELQSRVNLRNALADLARLEGSSLTHYHIDVAE